MLAHNPEGLAGFLTLLPAKEVWSTICILLPVEQISVHGVLLILANIHSVALVPMCLECSSVS